jgi:hypothetical protein
LRHLGVEVLDIWDQSCRNRLLSPHGFINSYFLEHEDTTRSKKATIEDTPNLLVEGILA